MTDSANRGPRKGAGLNELRLQASGARDELASTLNAIERKIAPLAKIAIGTAAAGAIAWGVIRFASANAAGRFGHTLARRG